MLRAVGYTVAASLALVSAIALAVSALLEEAQEGLAKLVGVHVWHYIGRVLEETGAGKARWCHAGTWRRGCGAKPYARHTGDARQT